MIQVNMSEAEVELLTQLNPDLNFLLNDIICEYLNQQMKEIEKFIKLDDKEAFTLNVLKDIQKTNYLFDGGK